MEVCFRNVLTFGIVILGLYVHNTTPAVPEMPLKCTRDRVPVFEHTEIQFAQWPASDECQTSYEVECVPGYEMTLVRNCTKDGSFCSPPELICSIIHCPKPYPIINATVSYNSTEYSSKAVYTCDEGLYMTLGNPVKTCEADKQWTFDDPYCSLEKPTAQPEPNATTTMEITTTAPQNNFTFGNYRAVFDNPAYEPQDAPDANMVGGLCFFFMCTPFIFLIAIDVIQISAVVKAKLKKWRMQKDKASGAPAV